MIKDPAVKLKLASDYAGIANYWKFFDGETKQLIKYKVFDQKKQYENDFAAWAKSNPAYKDIFTEYEKNYETWTPYSKHRQYLREGILGSPLSSFASSLIALETALTKAGATPEDIRKAADAANNAHKNFLKSEDLPSDKNILGAVAKAFYSDIDKSQHPVGVYEKIAAAYGDLNDEATFKKWALDVFSKTMLLNDDKWNSFIANPDSATLQSDAMFAFTSAFIKNYNAKYMPLYTAFVNKNNELGRTYLKGVIERRPDGGAKMYPDANFSMRVSFGNVKSYKPKDAVNYDFVTTASGIMEKYVPGDYEFDLPAKEVELIKNKDFGDYIDKNKKDLVVAFITTNDITGGNSGSPVMDAYGNLIGLAFDGNYEALSHKIAFDSNLNRTICVDVRYVLWCIDKLGGAKNLIDEIKPIK
jgi:hypothetical protein